MTIVVTAKKAGNIAVGYGPKGTFSDCQRWALSGGRRLPTLADSRPAVLKNRGEWEGLARVFIVCGCRHWSGDRRSVKAGRRLAFKSQISLEVLKAWPFHLLIQR